MMEDLRWQRDRLQSMVDQQRIESMAEGRLVEIDPLSGESSYARSYFAPSLDNGRTITQEEAQLQLNIQPRQLGSVALGEPDPKIDIA